MDRRQLLALGSAFVAAKLLAPAALAADGHGTLWQQDVEAAWKLAKETRRPLVILFTTDGCYHCERMAREISADPVVAKDLKAAFVPAIVHANDQPGLVRKLGISAFPTTVIVSPDAQVLDAIVGYAAPADLQGRLRSVRLARVPQ